MPPLPSWETIRYGPSVVPGERVIDAGGEYIAEGQRHVVEPCGVCLKLDFRLHPDPLTATPRVQKWL